MKDKKEPVTSNLSQYIKKKAVADEKTMFTLGARAKIRPWRYK